MAATKTPKHRNTANPEWNQAMHGKGSSSCTQPHQDRRTRGQRTRATAKRVAIRNSW